MKRTQLVFNLSDEHGDRPRPLPAISELKKATDITERKEGPSWDFDVSGLQLFFTCGISFSQQNEHIFSSQY